jgi:Homeodomain-like domain
MKAYSEDLRKKILQAVDRGMPKSEAAKTFGVSRSSIKRYAAARLKKVGHSPLRNTLAPNPSSMRGTGRSSKPTWKRGPPSPSKRGAASLRRWWGFL